MGKQRRDRQAYGKDGVSHRFLAALAAAATAAFLIAGPVAAMGAAWSGNPRSAPWHGHGDWGDQGSSSAGTQRDEGSAQSDQGAPGHGSGQHEQSGAGHRRGEHDGEQRTQASQGEQGNQGNQGSSSAASSPVPTPQLPITPALPSMPIPSNLFPAPASSPAAAATAASAAPRVPAAPNRPPTASAATGALAAPGLTAPPAVAPTPPGDLFPTPGAPKGGVLQTARSYSLLLALAAAVVVFLAVQGRLGRRDPRIATPARDDLDFEDFE